MNIHIMGASCAGATTLGVTLAKQLNYTYLDTDHYFWLPSEIPFTYRRDALSRSEMLKSDIEKTENAIIGGSLVNWGHEWLEMFELVVFLYVPMPIRMERLVARETELYGHQLHENPVLKAKFDGFLDWASGYDDNSTQGRNLAAHQSWLGKLTCPVIEIIGNTTVAHRADMVLSKLRRIANADDI